jgi:tRNA uridine 5-carboxymethylaminomethyl modification enzyme
VAERIEIELKYSGYLRRQEVEARRVANADQVGLPADLDYAGIAGLSREVVEKLDRIRPRSIGQASRISGVTPAAVAILLTYIGLTHRRRAAVPSDPHEAP